MNYTYLLTYSYNQEKFLPEFLTYYKSILKFNEIIIIEDFSSTEKYNQTKESKYKKICDVFGTNVTYDYYIRSDPNSTHGDNQRLVVKKYIDALKQNKNPNQYVKWLLYIDVDEFLNLKGLTINNFLKKNNKITSNYNGITFMQQLFGHNNVPEHNIDDLVIDTHRKSIKIDHFEKKWRSESWDNYCKENNIVGKTAGWPIGRPEVCNKGFKGMYKINKINKGWVHPREMQDVKSFTCKQNLANINHYWIITKNDIENHYDSHRILCRKYVSIDLEQYGKIYSRLFNLKNIIKSNKDYQNAITLLKDIDTLNINPVDTLNINPVDTLNINPVDTLNAPSINN
jgi:hypothetical protein